MRFLLLSCCAPCSCAVIEKLAQEKADFAVLFYNPNIRPLAEYQKRRDENERLCRKYGVKFIELEYEICLKGISVAVFAFRCGLSVLLPMPKMRALTLLPAFWAFRATKT